MTFRLKVILVYFTAAVMSLGLCWNIYLSAHKVSDTFSTFTNNDLEVLDNLLSFRANLAEHERLLYEYYTTTNRTEMLVKLALVHRSLEEDLSLLKKKLHAGEHYLALNQIYTEFSTDAEQLDTILHTAPIDWDNARNALARLSEHGRAAAPEIDKLSQMVRSHSKQTQTQVKQQLKSITLLVVGFITVVLITTLIISYATREMLRADLERRRLAYFPERNPTPIFSLTLDGDVTYTNPAGHRVAALIDENLPSVLPPDIKQRIQTLCSSGKQSQTYEYKLHEHVFSARLQLLSDPELCHVYVTDITEQRVAQEKLRFLAYNDPVTALPNRHSFLNDCKAWVDKQDFSFSVSMIGFLRFELISRSLGIDIVDELLKSLGQRLNTALATTGKEIHTVRLYRISGAGFAVLLRAQQDSNLRALTEKLADLLLLEAAQPLRVHRREFWLLPAIGASFCPDDTILPDVLIGSAKASLASLVTDCRSGYQALTPEIMGEEERWLATETALRNGLENGEFCLHYQPKVAAVDGRVCGFEALIRWDRGASGFANPAEFIPIAEQSGLILPLGTWVLEEACRQTAAWVKSGQKHFTVAVNVSALQFQQAEFITHVKLAMHRHNLDPQYLELEITESLLMQDLEQNIATLKALRELGLGLAIDDFGTGYSSLEYLNRFPVTQLKIDRAFIINITDDPRESAIVQAMIELAHRLDLKVVAEGVETQEQSAMLRRLGCDEFQGYYYSRPIEKEAVLAWWADNPGNGPKRSPRAVNG